MSVVTTTPSSPPQRPAPNPDRRGPRRGPGLAGFLARWTRLAEDEILGLGSLVAPGAVCVDVGANYGLYTHALSRLVGPGGIVHSVEPLPGAFRVLTAALTLVSPRNVQRHQVALGACTGRGVLSLPIRRGLPVHGRAFLTAGASHCGPNAEFAAARPVAVEVVTLDELCEREEIARVDFLKADVEGTELAVLRGGVRTIATHRPALLLEIEERHARKYGHGAADVVAWLADRGYRMHRWWDGGWRSTGQTCAAARNYLFVHHARAADARPRPNGAAHHSSPLAGRW